MCNKAVLSPCLHSGQLYQLSVLSSVDHTRRRREHGHNSPRGGGGLRAGTTATSARPAGRGLHRRLVPRLQGGSHDHPLSPPHPAAQHCSQRRSTCVQRRSRWSRRTGSASSSTRASSGAPEMRSELRLWFVSKSCYVGWEHTCTQSDGAAGTRTQGDGKAHTRSSGTQKSSFSCYHSCHRVVVLL